MTHTFSICAYKESPYLEECILSILHQTIKSNVILCTSTPNQYIKDLANKYKVPLFIRAGKSNIRDDWNYAYTCAYSDYVTIAHQDDKYHPDYTKELFGKVANYSPNDILIFLSDYLPLKHNNIMKRDINSRFRKILRSPLNIRCLSNKRWCKKMVLSMGNSICCPSVTYNKSMLTKPPFTSDFQFNIDWDTFLKLANENGYFVYCNKPLTYYRIHNEATSKQFIVDHKREYEDTCMFQKFWPNWLVKIIMHFYKYAYKTYDN